MKAHLMYKDRDFDLKGELPSNRQALTQDLELSTLFKSMALGDDFLFEVAKKAVLSGLNNLDTILYRQNILKDCLNNPSIIRDIYDITIESIERKKKTYFGFFNRYPSSILHSSIDVLQIFVDILKKLRIIADAHADKFASEGFRLFFTMLKKELGDEYFACVQNHLEELKFRNGVLISAELGEGNKGSNYILRKPQGKTQDKKESWVQRIFAKKQPVFTIFISERDESGARALSELKDKGINLVANALSQSADHILSFFNMLRTELAFYVGCLNLYERLAQIGEPVSFPLPVDAGERRHSFKGLYDVCLALSLEQKIVGNDVNADGKDLVMITGANQGGKSTFLRSIGLAQLMMQCGMFVPAESFSSNICQNLFTHYKREEDTTMNSGKLDEELGRMSDIVDKITPNSMLLFNESFAATNEREGSEIARQIISALLERRVKVFFVTHLYEFAHGFYDKKLKNTLFLRAERQNDGRRTFKLVDGEPLQTSFGEDLYNGIFGTGS
ncbi:DNA mismatch repair protein MutS [Pelotomaculum propionicicum]|uniref:DNA mismatch repair protein MutS n=2 Tax=Pelotomaculum propionicicum TaxID=258475 RepID=A0A4Y7RVW5_9FIRM|nr:DNA mismatch repair protein MutS [Peptococcaceae bacterium]TEB12910.1 DNA mismatch repair protein MutS [Pelotomaculum propionicicum]